MAILAALAVTLLNDGRQKFKFKPEPSPTPKATPLPAPTPPPNSIPAEVSAAALPIAAGAASAAGLPVQGVEPTGGIQSLFVAEQAGRTEARQQPESLFVPESEVPQYRVITRSPQSVGAPPAYYNTYADQPQTYQRYPYADQPQAYQRYPYAEQPQTYQPIREADMARLYATSVKVNKRAIARVARMGGFRSAQDMAAAFGYPSVEEMVGVWDQRIQTGQQFTIEDFGNSAQGITPAWDTYR